MAPQTSSLSIGTRNEWLDVLRGLAIFSVVAVHSVQVTDQLVPGNKSEIFSVLLGFGKYGVELFFFLSGWLLISIYGFNGQALGKSYWARRIARIYPLWILFLIIAFFRWEYYDSAGRGSPLNVSYGQSSFMHSPIGIILLSLTFTLFLSASLWNNVIPGGWSIQSEMAHYLLFVFIRNKKINSIINVCIVINLISLCILSIRPKMERLPNQLLQIIDSWFRLGLYSTFAYFLFGIIGNLVLKQIDGQGLTALRSLREVVSLKSFIIYFLSFLFLPCPFGKQFEAVIYLCLMIIISFGILKYKYLSIFFQFLGRYSYFTYFMHLLAVASVHWLAANNYIASEILVNQQLVFLSIFLYALIISSLLAVPSMVFFERPIIRLAHKVR